jgi:hypothetical protein
MALPSFSRTRRRPPASNRSEPGRVSDGVTAVAYATSLTSQMVSVVYRFEHATL